MVANATEGEEGRVVESEWETNVELAANRRVAVRARHMGRTLTRNMHSARISAVEQAVGAEAHTGIHSADLIFDTDEGILSPGPHPPDE